MLVYQPETPLAFWQYQFTLRKKTFDMEQESESLFSRQRRVGAWLVHLFTASGAVIGLFTYFFIHHGEYIAAFWLMGAAILIDGIDGMFARWARTKEAAAKIDGELLDNIIDYSNYVMAPAFFLLVGGLLPQGWNYLGPSLVVLASAYQFSQPDAKTEDHFFKGFPSYWNIVVFYLFFWQTSPRTNMIIVLVLVVLVFVPTSSCCRASKTARAGFHDREIAEGPLIWDGDPLGSHVYVLKGAHGAAQGMHWEALTYDGSGGALLPLI